MIASVQEGADQALTSSRAVPGHVAPPSARTSHGGRGQRTSNMSSRDLAREKEMSPEGDPDCSMRLE